MIKNIIISMRPKQWTKNLLIFAGLIFSQNLANTGLLLKTIGTFLLFCLISGVIYIFNDVLDFQTDQMHSTKKIRPIASGALSRKIVLPVAVVMAAVGIILSFLINVPTGIVTICYLVLMSSYSLWLKHLVIIDVFTIAAGFVLRAVAGAEAIEVPISDWLLICVILLSLFLALAKRRQELQNMTDTGKIHRALLLEYSDKLLDQMIAVVTAAVVVCYSLYTMWTETTVKFGTGNMKYTIPIVLYGIFRYLYLIYRRNQGEEPETVLWTDRWLLISILIYVLAVYLIIYQ